MIDFESLEYSFAEDRKIYSFVGIQEKKLYLPLGFKPKPSDDDLDQSYSRKKKLFFLLYRTLRKFMARLDKYHKNDFSSKDRDGTGKGAVQNTFTIETEDGAEEVVYTRLSGIDDVLEGFDELRLFALRERMRSSDKIDYSQIHRYLDKATYLNNDTIYIDQMQIAKPTLHYHTTDLVRMYCYIYREIKQELEEKDDIGAEVIAEAENFEENHLSPDDSLFGEHTNDRTRDLLCEQLERIGEQTAFKDDAYWHFYEAIEAILYPQNRKVGDDGIHWGINNFCFVWEDMCQDTLESLNPYNILYADRLDGIRSKDNDLRASLTISADVSIDSCKKITSVIRPDAVVELKNDVQENKKILGGEHQKYKDALSELTNDNKKGYRIIDFKYKLSPDEQDMRKQLIYQFALEKNMKRGVQSVFVIPSEDKESKHEIIANENYKENKFWQVSTPMEIALIDYAKDSFR